MHRLQHIAAESRLFLAALARASIFGASLLTLILATGWWYPAAMSLARYDFLFLAALAIQALLLLSRLETVEEAVVILVFHACGTLMELFKTKVGSWAYPEASILHIAGVPLFSGFMYSAVGSAMAQLSRLFDFRFSAYPRMRWTLVLAALIYENFFTHHFIPDLRLGLFALAIILFWRVRVHFTIGSAERSMPLLLAFLVTAAGVWLAENIGTFSRIWIYPNQASGFAMVPATKLGAWYLLTIVSFVLISLVHRPVLVETASGREQDAGTTDGTADDLGCRQPVMG